jgi:hypothetical protein
MREPEWQTLTSCSSQQIFNLPTIPVLLVLSQIVKKIWDMEKQPDAARG